MYFSLTRLFNIIHGGKKYSTSVYGCLFHRLHNKFIALCISDSVILGFTRLNEKLVHFLRFVTYPTGPDFPRLIFIALKNTEMCNISHDRPVITQRSGSIMLGMLCVCLQIEYLRIDGIYDTW